MTFHAVSYLDLVRGGLTAINSPLRVGLDFRGPRILEPWSHYRLVDFEWIPEEAGGNIELTYNISEFVGVERSSESSDHVIHSSAKCTIFRLDGYKYWRDYGSDNQTSKGILYKPGDSALMGGVVKLTYFLKQTGKIRITVRKSLKY